ncbi:hypothetical protein HY380_00385 [Candidatus Saccharibacteria bacterium]|nr:hypothetical protein [Candidatus Saccharibacteria bacterium]
MTNFKTNELVVYTMSLLRIGLGYIFLWAFLDKLFGLGFTTCKNAVSGAVDIGCNAAWINGGSPTEGFLGNAVSGPMANFYHNLAGLAWVDWLFMIGLAFIGLGLLLGTWVRSAAAAGIIMLLLMYSALLWPTHAPGVDEHVIYAIALYVLLVSDMPHKWSLHGWWLKTAIAKRLPLLR